MTDSEGERLRAAFETVEEVLLEEADQFILHHDHRSWYASFHGERVQSGDHETPWEAIEEALQILRSGRKSY